MAGFQHDIAGGNGELIVPQVQSPNFSISGQTGWAILKNGDAYFYDVTAAGSIAANMFNGTDFTINTDGTFFYSGTPASGNLIISITNAPGTDGEGNAYLAGTTTYALDGSTYTATTLASGQLNAYTATAPGGPWTLVGSLAFDPVSGWLTVTSAPLNCEDHLFVSGGSFEVTNSVSATFTGSVTINGTLTVGGSSNTSTNGLTDGTINGSSSTTGLPNGDITGTSGAQSTGTAHTHSAGSYAVTNGQHSHGSGSYAVTNGQHDHAL